MLIWAYKITYIIYHVYIHLQDNMFIWVYICEGELNHGLNLGSFQSYHDHSSESYVKGVLQLCYNSSKVPRLYHLN